MNDAVRFYQTLGFKQIVDTAHYARFESINGSATFSLALDNSDFVNGAVIYFECQTLDDWVEKLKAKGLVFEQEPTDERYLWREAIIRDPSGNKIKLYWAGDNRLNPPWRVN